MNHGGFAITGMLRLMLWPITHHLVTLLSQLPLRNASPFHRIPMVPDLRRHILRQLQNVQHCYDDLYTNLH